MTRLAKAILHRLLPVVLAGRATYRKVVRPITVGVRALVVWDDQILLVRAHGSSLWDLPGGGVKRGETLRAAAVRETREEAGCTVEPD